MFFNLKKKHTLLKESLKFNDIEIEKTTSFKFLDILLDDKLRWNDHFEMTENKLRKAKILINISKQLMPEHILKMVYYTQFHSYFTYGDQC